jgi:dCTP deaminase
VCVIGIDGGVMNKHVTNISYNSYNELWRDIFKDHYQDKYQHESGLSGGGGNYPFYDIHLKQEVILLPEHRFCLASSIERFTVPMNWYLLPKNKSSIARLGIDASFNTVIDNGFNGWLTIEIVNHSNVTVYLKAGQPILKLEARQCELPCLPYGGKYQNQPDKPVSSK